jgi:hypothetical protein
LISGDLGQDLVVRFFKQLLNLDIDLNLKFAFSLEEVAMFDLVD